MVAIDGFELLRSIGSNREAFADASAVVSKSALTIVVGQLKAKGLTLSKLRAVRTALGAPTFALVLEGLDDKGIASLLTKLDKYNPGRTTGSPAWKRTHVFALSSREAEPSEQPPSKQKRAIKAKGGSGRKQKAASTAADPFWPQSMEVSPRRKQRDTGQ